MISDRRGKVCFFRWSKQDSHLTEDTSKSVHWMYVTKGEWKTMKIYGRSKSFKLSVNSKRSGDRINLSGRLVVTIRYSKLVGITDHDGWNFARLLCFLSILIKYQQIWYVKRVWKGYKVLKNHKWYMVHDKTLTMDITG